MTTQQEMHFNDRDVAVALEQYIATALWSSTDFITDEPLDENYDESDLGIGTLRVMEDELRDFLESANHILKQADDREDWRVSFSDIGRDFWLTRNGHGAGFWDGGYPDDVGRELTALAKAQGSVDLYIGDDGLIYQ